MAINWDLYNTKLNINGNTKRERDLYGIKSTLASKLPDLLSYKSVTINSEVRSIELVKDAKGYIKEIHSLPDETFDCGDYVVYNSKTYLIIEIDNDKEVYTIGKMQYCTYTLLFQHPITGTILSYPCIDETNSSIGISEKNVITTPNGIHTIKLPFDENTELLTEGKRLIVDKRNTSTPSVYEISKVNSTEYNYGDKGLLELTLTQGSFNETTDRADLKICNYFEPIITPPTPDPTVPTEIVTITSDATNNEVKLGVPYTFIATFKNELGADVTNVIAEYSIDNTYGGKVVLVDNGDGTATVTVGDFGDSDLCTKEFTLTCLDAAHGFSSSILLTIVGLF